MIWGIIFIIPTLLAEHKVSRVNDCPKYSTQWHTRAREFSCQQGKSYHCILSFNSSLFEVCIQMKIYHPNIEGCPWISFQDDEPIFGAKNTKCPITLNGCPANHMGYTSDQLYQYPACFIPEKERQNISLSTDVVPHKTTCSDNPSHIWQSVGISFIVIFALLLTLVAIKFVIDRKRKMRRNDAEDGNPTEDKLHLLPQSADMEYPIEDQADGHVHPFVETEYYRQMYDLLLTGNAVWLSGIYGSGKSRCAKAYARSTESILIKIHCLDSNALNKGIKKQIKRSDDNHNHEHIEFTDDVSILLENLAERQKASEQNVVILFCHVTNETSERVEKLAAAILNRNGFKCIATSFDNNVFAYKEGPFDERIVIRCNKGFTEKESLQFFSSNLVKTKEDSQAVEKFTREFDGHPLTLATARTKMHQLSETPAEFLQNFKGTVHFENSIVNNEFKSILSFLHDNTDNETIMKLLKLLQFVKCTNIPIYIFRYLFDNEQISQLSMDSFVIFIQQYSFGEVKEEGDRRMINVHKAVHILLRTNTDNEVQSTLLMKMLMTLNCLFSTNQSCSSDRERCIGLLEHATETIAVAQDLQIPHEHCLEKSFALILLCEKVSHTYRLKGDLKMHAKYIRIALDICYEAILQNRYVTPGQCFCEKAYKEKAAEIFNRVEAALYKSNDLLETTKQYSLKKFRSKSLIKELLKRLGKEADNKKVNLTEEEYSELEKEGYAVHRDTLARNSLTELVINIFLSYGLLPMSTQCEDLDKSAYNAHVHVSLHLAKCLSHLLPSHLPLCRSRAEISGTMEIFLTECESAVYGKGQRLSSTSMKEVSCNCDKLDKWMKTERRFFMYGIYVLENSSPEFEIICRRQMLRCSALLYSQSPNENRRRLQEQEARVNGILSDSTYQCAESLPILRQALESHHMHMKQFKHST